MYLICFPRWKGWEKKAWPRVRSSNLPSSGLFARTCVLRSCLPQRHGFPAERMSCVVGLKDYACHRSVVSPGFATYFALLALPPSTGT